MKITTINNLTNFLIIFVLTLFVGYFFMQVYPFGQRAVDAALVLAKLVDYPDQISPMSEYFLKSWTSTHQFSKLLLNLNWSFSGVSKLIIFLTAVIYFLGIVLTIKSASRSTAVAILVALMTLIFQKNFGDTDYPSMIFSEHTYGMLSLAIVTFAFGLLFAGSLFFVGFFLAILISIHILVGIWINGIIITSLVLNKYFFKYPINYSMLIKGFAIGIILTIISFVYHQILTTDFVSYFSLEAYDNYMKYWEGHRNETEYHIEYFLKTLVLFGFGTFCLIALKNNLTENFKFGLICVLTSIFLSTVFYFSYKIFYPYMPDLIVRTMPARYTIMHSIIGWPLILGMLFVFIQKFEKKNKIFNNSALFLIILIILFYSVSHYKVFIKLQNLFINKTIEITSVGDKNFWNLVKNYDFNGYILTSFSSSTISMRKTLKPIILDVSSFDFVPYHPNTAKNMSIIIEKIYGISFADPPMEVRNRPYLSDEIVKLSFEKYSREKWQQLSKDFNIGAIIVPVKWKINLIPNAEGERFAFYVP